MSLEGQCIDTPLQRKDKEQLSRIHDEGRRRETSMTVIPSSLESFRRLTETGCSTADDLLRRLEYTWCSSWALPVALTSFS